MLSEEGQVTVLAPQDEYKKLAQFKMDEGFLASPAVIGDTLIVRSTKALYRIE